LNSEPVNRAYVAMFRSARRLLDPTNEARAPRMDRNARAHLLLSEAFWAVAWLNGIMPSDYGRTAQRFGAILSDGLAARDAKWPKPQQVDLSADGDTGRSASSEMFLRAATKLINAEGYHGASVDRISAELKVSKGSFYHHNETKDDLVVACFQRTFNLMWRAIWAAEAQGGTGLETLAAVCSTLIRHQFGGVAPLLRTSALTTVPETLRHSLMADLDRLSLRFASVISDGVADGSIRPIDVNIAAQMITGMVNAAAELHYWAPEITIETATDHYLRPLFQGIVAP
jgi:AcrR family transcriptional regulator